MDIVLIQMPFYGIDCPPIGLALLKSYLAQNNISCKIIDFNIRAYRFKEDKYSDYWDVIHGYDFCEDNQKMLEYYKNNRVFFLHLMSEIMELNPSIVGCSCQSSSFILSKIFMEDLRNCKPGFKHILGGPNVAGFMNNADELLATDYIDAVNLDEGEVSLTSYFYVVKKNTSELVPGLIYKKDGRMIRGGPTVFVKNLDELPFPDFSDFNFKDYIHPRLMPSYTSRCCINKCIYCTAKNYMKPFRFRSAERIFEEIKYQKDRHPAIDYVHFLDNVSNANIGELEAFCDLMIKSKLGIGWRLDNAIIRKEMRAPLYGKLKKAGCGLIGYGMETFSSRLLQKSGKILSRDVDIAKVLYDGRKAGIYISINIMFGLPGETEEDFESLMNFLIRHRNSFDMVYPSINFCDLYPGTDGREDPNKYGLDCAKGYLYWESMDKSNTYPIRMERFERFCEIAKKHRLPNLFSVKEYPNKKKLLFKYYFISKEYDKAMMEYDKIKPEERTAEVEKMYMAIKTNDFNILRNDPVKLRNILKYGKTFRETFLMASLTENIENLCRTDIFDIPFQGQWKKKMRSLIHLAMGYDLIEKNISRIYCMLKIMDEKIRCYIEKE